MGQRTSTETLIAIITAFWQQRSWAQAELARAVGTSPRTARKYLEELTLEGWPLERDEDHPHVYWSVPRDWFPGGLLLQTPEAGALAHLLLRVPPSPERERLQRLLLRNAPALLSSAVERVLPPRTSENEERHLPLFLDAVAQRHPIQMRYYSASRGALGTRVVSPQRVLAGAPARMVAYCHEAKALRWFRLEHVAGARREDGAPFRDVPDDDVEVFLDESVDGYHGQRVTRAAFFVREPESHWVMVNLPQGLHAHPVDGGVRVEAHTAGLLPIARFVVGLGGAARPLSDELASKVRELAQEALDSIEATSTLNDGAVGANGPTESADCGSDTGDP